MNITAIKQVLKDVGEYQLREQNKLSSDDIEMKGHNDPVTLVDKQSELMLEEGLNKILEAEFRGEERPWSLWKDKCWVVDPLDGTKAYIARRPGWGISVALFDGKEVIAGFIFLPQENAFYHAFKGEGAFKNNKPIHVDPEKSDCVVSSFFQNLGCTVHDGGAWKCAKVAEGRFGAYPHWAINGKGVQIWDLAAGALIVEEAGGFAGDFSGNPFDFFQENSLVEESFISGNKNLKPPKR